MSKLYLNVNLSVIVDTDLTDVNDIIDETCFDVFGTDDSIVFVEQSEVRSASIEDAK